MHEPKLTIDVSGILHLSTRPTLAKSSVLDKVLQQSQNGECPFVDRDGMLFTTCSPTCATAPFRQTTTKPF